MNSPIKEKILEIITGSYLYGTNTESSDKDYLGIFIPKEEYILGFRNVEEVDLSRVTKTEAGKNTSDSIDRKLYEFRKYMKLAMENNPNILETLFVNNKNIVEINEVGKELLNNRHLFPYKGLKQKFLGYAFSQKHKMIIKKDHYFDLLQAYDYLDRFDSKKYIMEVALMNNCPNFLKQIESETHNTKFIKVGDLNLLPQLTITSARAKIKERLDKVGNREELLTKYGFDCKFAHHAVRLLLEGKELLLTGELQFPLKEASMLLDIKTGKWKMMDVINYIELLEKEYDDIVAKSKLPVNPRFKEIEEFTIKTIKRYII